MLLKEDEVLSFVVTVLLPPPHPPPHLSSFTPQPEQHQRAMKVNEKKLVKPARRSSRALLGCFHFPVARAADNAKATNVSGGTHAALLGSSTQEQSSSSPQPKEPKQQRLPRPAVLTWTSSGYCDDETVKVTETAAQTGGERAAVAAAIALRARFLQHINQMEDDADIRGRGGGRITAATDNTAAASPLEPPQRLAAQLLELSSPELASEPLHRLEAVVAIVFGV